MRRPKPPPFLEREVYRQRRLADAARLLPVLGLLLFFLPILWAPQSTPEPDTVSGGTFIFVVWGMLILAAWGLSRWLLDKPSRKAPQDEEES